LRCRRHAEARDLGPCHAAPDQPSRAASVFQSVAISVMRTAAGARIWDRCGMAVSSNEEWAGQALDREGRPGHQLLHVRRHLRQQLVLKMRWSLSGHSPTCLWISRLMFSAKSRDCRVLLHPSSAGDLIIDITSSRMCCRWPPESGGDIRRRAYDGLDADLRAKGVAPHAPACRS